MVVIHRNTVGSDSETNLVNGQRHPASHIKWPVTPTLILVRVSSAREISSNALRALLWSKTKSNAIELTLTLVVSCSKLVK